MFAKSPSLRGQGGQTSIEYVLIFSVAATLVLSFSDRLEEFMVGNGNCPNESLLCTFQAAYTGGGLQANYRRFTLRR